MIVNMVQPLTRPILSSLTDAITAALGGSNIRGLLFSAGEQGAWYDLSDSTTLFADSAGTTPAVVNGPVGLQLDKSQGLVLGAELVTNGDFSSSAGWNVNAGWTIAGGKASFSSASTANINRLLSTTAGKWYRIEFEVLDYVAGSVYAQLNNPGSSVTPTYTSNGVKVSYVLATANFIQVSVIAAASSNLSVDNISVKELPGNHRYQATATSRPTLRGTPNGLDGDGTDDSMLIASSGGGTTGFLFQSAIKLDVISKRQTLWSDAGTNTGYKVELNASNQLVFSAGNGTAYTSVTTANTVAAGTTYSVECYDDGTNLVAILNQGTPATAARPTVSAGTASFTMQKDNGAASGFMDGVLYSAIYLRNTAKNSTTRAAAMRWIRQKAGL